MARFKFLTRDEVIAYAVPDEESELKIYTHTDGTQYYFNEEGLRIYSGICGLNVTNCYSNPKTQKHSYESQRRLQEVMSVVGSDPYHNFLGYTVKRNVGTSRYGSFVYFTYGVAVINERLGSHYKIHSSNVLNYNKVIKELRNAYKNDMEYYLNQLNRGR
ncbi:hypothetical protein OQH60_05740 [Campylobacter sp. MIT 21-1685]|nr:MULTISPECIES: hypothetical protein [unclassified Campylobacter]MCX2683426.1 hypothetical protein [Campylobacter sp. MIT 21-1684]MCX2751647.1 hypothetical protein [Campylobacter sp. MIT 21-1682]MCX2807848.1 hypothetical protein [Campylobacter sp. MIT 21-1685]